MTTIELSHVDIELSYCNDPDHEGSSCSQFYSVAGGSSDDARFSLNVSDKSSRSSTVSECSVMEVEIMVHSVEDENVCRICHLSLDSTGGGGGSGGGECEAVIELGCSCKDDLAVAHRHCAEVWFKIKGNKTCEICNAVARNVVGGNESAMPSVPSNEDDNDSVMETERPVAMPIIPRPRRCWNCHRFLNFLLACMVFAFVISWLFHFNVPS